MSGTLHVPAGTPAQLASSDPAVVLASRDLLVPFTDATITYDRADEPTTESFETILVNRAQATWIDLDEAAERGADGELIGHRMPVYHAALPKTYTPGRSSTRGTPTPRSAPRAR